MFRILRLIAGLVLLCTTFAVVAVKFYLPTVVSFLLTQFSPTLQFESRDFSTALLRGEVVLYDAVIKENGEVRAAIDEFALSVSPRKLLFGRTLVVERLFADIRKLTGLDDQSAFWQMLLAGGDPQSSDQSSSFLLPVQIRDGLIELRSADFTIGSLQYELEQLRITVVQESVEQMNTRGEFQELTLTLIESDTRPIVIQNLHVDANITDDTIFVEGINAKVWDSIIGATGEVQESSLRASSQKTLAAADIPVDFERSGTLDAITTVSGPYDELTVCSDLVSGENFSLYFNQEVVVRQVSLEFCTTFDGEIPTTHARRLEVSGAGFSLRVLEPIQLANDKLRGQLELSIPKFQSGDSVIEGAKLAVDLYGSLATPEGKLRLTIERALLIEGGQSLDNVVIAGDVDGSTAVLSGRAFLAGRASGAVSAGINFTLNAPDGRLQIEPSSLTIESTVLRVGEGDHNTIDVALQGKLHGSGSYDLRSPQDFSKLLGQLHLAIGPVTDDERESFKASYGIEELLISGKLLQGEEIAFNIQSKPAGLLHADVSVGTTSPYPVDGNFAFTRFALPEFTETPLCASVSASGEFSLPLSSYQSGEAELAIEQFDAGCTQELLSLSEPARFILENDELRGSVKIVSSTSDTASVLSITGRAGQESFAVEAQGDLRLQAVGPLVPQMTNVRGEVDLQLRASGTYSDPVIVGRAAIGDGGFIVPDPPIDVRHIGGSITLGDRGELGGTLSALVNNGTATLHTVGSIHDWESTNAEFQFRDIRFAPVKNSRVILGGEITVYQLASPRKIAGDIDVQEAYYESEIGIATLLSRLRQSLSGLFSSSGSLPAVPTERAREGVEGSTYETEEEGLEFDISLTRSGDVRFVSNFAVVELSPQLTVSGTSEQLALIGDIFLESGWFAVGSHRFALTSGSVNFSDSDSDPLVEIRGQSAVVTKSYERVQIEVLVTGPVSAPQVEFTSTSGLNQREILQLLTSAGGGSFVQSALGEATLDVFGEDSIAGGLRGVTALDSLTVQPDFSAERGSIAPRITAGKQLTPRVELESSTLIGEADSSASVTGRYRLSDRWAAEAGFATAGASRDQSSYAGVRYEIIRSHDRVEFFIEGASQVSGREIRRRLAINEASRFERSDIVAIENRIRALYRERGFEQARIRVECSVPQAELCLSILVRIDEGEPNRIEGVRLSGVIPDSLQQQLQDVLKGFIGKPASERNRVSAQGELIAVLRKQSYPSAFTRVEFVSCEIEVNAPDQLTAGDAGSGGAVCLEAFVESGARIEVRLSGNEEYDAEDLLELANFYSQQVPFGERVAATLAQRIQDIYHNNGFLSAHTSHFCTQDDEVSICEVQVVEGTQLGIEAVEVRFDASALAEEVLGKVRAKGTVSRAVLDDRVRILNRELVRLGYISPAVRYHLGNEDNGKVTLYFEGNLSEQRTAEQFRIHVRDGGTLPESIPEQPSVLAIPQLRSYVEELRRALQHAGYHRAELHFEFSEAEALVAVSLGEPTRIGSILVRGNEQVSSETIRRVSTLKSSQVVRQGAIQNARRRLYQMGRFRDVRISRSESGGATPAEENLIIEVIELGPRELTLGAGYDSTYGVRTTVDGVERTLFDGSGTIRAFADLYYSLSDGELSRGGLNLSYIDPLFLDSKARFSTTLAYLRSTKTVQEFELSRTSLSTMLQRNLSERWQFGVGHSFLYEDLRDVSPDAVLSRFDTGDVFLSILSGSAAYDSTDSPLNPRSGLRANLNTKLASSAIGSEADYIGVEPSMRWLYPIGDFPFSFQLDGRLGMARHFGGTAQIPITQRYYLGGADSVRGFKEFSLGPRGEAGSVLGGNIFYAGAAQLNYFITNAIDIHTFLDVGRLWFDGGPNDSQRESVGVGARYASPVGPISLSVGFPLDRRDGENVARLHFSIGASF